MSSLQVLAYVCTHTMFVLPAWQQLAYNTELWMWDIPFLLENNALIEWYEEVKQNMMYLKTVVWN